MKTNLLKKLLIQILLIIIVITQIFPMFWLFYSTFKPTNEIAKNVFGFPHKVTFENYINAWTDEFIKIPVYFRNSIIITSLSLLLLIIVSTLGAYACAKYKFPGRNILLFFLIIVFGIPAHAIIIPLYFFFADLGLLNHYLSLILVYGGFMSPLSIILLHSYFRKFPDEIMDAARIDGSNDIRTFLYIVVPISKGAISSVAIINFVFIWNEFLFALVMMKNNPSKTLPVGLFAYMGLYKTEFGPFFASMIIALVPTIVFYLIFNRFIIKGMVLGSIKE